MMFYHCGALYMLVIYVYIDIYCYFMLYLFDISSWLLLTYVLNLLIFYYLYSYVLEYLPTAHDQHILLYLIQYVIWYMVVMNNDTQYIFWFASYITNTSWKLHNKNSNHIKIRKLINNINYFKTLPQVGAYIMCWQPVTKYYTLKTKNKILKLSNISITS